MATNPPIIIGELANVPAPGSGVKSDVGATSPCPAESVHRFATVAACDAAYPAADRRWPGRRAVTADTDHQDVSGAVWYRSDGVEQTGQSAGFRSPKATMPGTVGIIALGGDDHQRPGNVRRQSAVNQIPILRAAMVVTFDCGATGSATTCVATPADPNLDAAQPATGHGFDCLAPHRYRTRDGQQLAFVAYQHRPRRAEDSSLPTTPIQRPCSLGVADRIKP